MRHRTAERWVSDDLDRALSADRKRKLTAHLAGCPACRAYRTGLETIQAGAVPRDPGFPADYWESRLAALRAGLEKPCPGPRTSPVPARRVTGFFPWKPWAWAGGGTALAAAAVLFFLLLPGRPLYDTYALALGDPGGAIEAHLGTDVDALREFNTSLETSLSPAPAEESADVLSFLGEQAFVLENLSDEEIRLINREIAREIGI